MGEAAGSDQEHRRGHCASSQWPASGHRRRVRHEALLTLARKTRAAAEDGDTYRLEHAVSYLLDELTLHVRDERSALIVLVPGEERILARGQGHLLSDVAALAEATSTGCAGQTKQCVNRVQEVLTRLYFQARDERLAFHDPAA
ncbi:hypothetical protein [Metallibacterium scheffleri]|uniref:hypothetical protein n=1 Tax=Metallibacterium scheffleri TaxID=993689 RepID=UPI0023F1F167|nr:hypothetical protein [Metallibacterium scheffleri]